MTGPPNEKGGCVRAAQQNVAVEHYHWRNTAQVCAHGTTVTERMPAAHAHFAQVKCAVCGRHIRWEPRPETVERRKLNGFRLAQLGMCFQLTEWQRQFVQSVSTCRTLSPKQQAVVDRLYAEHLGGTP
jgi:hypothetical protein